MAQINCPHCNQPYTVTEEQVRQMAGQSITCTKCQKAFALPGAVAPQPVQYATPTGPTKSNGMAIASLICGLLSCLFIPGILAIVFGILGIKRTRDPQVGGKGLAIAGIILGGLGVLGAPCIASITLPAIASAREAARRAQCANNMRQIGIAMLMYANDNQQKFPDSLETLMKDQNLSGALFICPTSTDTPAASADQLSTGGHLSYVYVGEGLTGMSPGNAVLLYDHHGSGVNFLYADGHVNYIPSPLAQATISAVQNGENPPKDR